MNKKMSTILGILGGIIALAIIIFKGMDMSNTIPEDRSPHIETTSPSSGNSNSSYDNNSTNTPSTSTTTKGIEDTSTSTPSTTNTSGTVNVDQKWLCIPFERVGLIQAKFNENDLKRVCGTENVVREEVGREWGETIPGTIVYPNSPYQITVEWRDGRAYEVIEKIRIEGDSAQWQTQQGIHIGSTLNDLVAINGNSFEFHGFEWDYSGKVASWNNGTIKDGITIFLAPENPAAVFPHLLGDDVYSTTNPKALEAELRVGAMEILMNKGVVF